MPPRVCQHDPDQENPTVNALEESSSYKILYCAVCKKTEIYREGPRHLRPPLPAPASNVPTFSPPKKDARGNTPQGRPPIPPSPRRPSPAPEDDDDSSSEDSDSDSDFNDVRSGIDKIYAQLEAIRKKQAQPASPTPKPIPRSSSLGLSKADVHKSRDLHEFEKVRDEYKDELEADPIIAAHLSELYDSMLEQHLLRVIEPYSEVQLAHVTQKVKLDMAAVESKLSQMILDKRLNGTIDQANSCLIVFEDDHPDNAYPAALATVENFSTVIDALVDKWHGKFEKLAEEEKKKDDEKSKHEDAEERKVDPK